MSVITAPAVALPPLVPLPLHTDESLARRVGAGEEQAFDVLYRRYQSRMERYCRSILRHDDDARDATQNALGKALVALREGRAGGSIAPWLFHIARNESISILRGRRPTTELSDEHGALAVAQQPLAHALLREQLAATLDGIRALPERSREALILREVAGLRYEHVGEALGISAGAARQAVHAAREALSIDRAGRDEDCSVIRGVLSDADRRRHASRTVRAHLSGCGACRSWRRAREPRAVRLLTWPAGGSLWAWLGGVASSGSGGAAIEIKLAAGVTAIAAAGVPVLTHASAERVMAHARPAHVASATPQRTTTKARTTPSVASLQPHGSQATLAVAPTTAVATRPRATVRTVVRVVGTSPVAARTKAKATTTPSSDAEPKAHTPATPRPAGPSATTEPTPTTHPQTQTTQPTAGSAPAGHGSFASYAGPAAGGQADWSRRGGLARAARADCAATTTTPPTATPGAATTATDPTTTA